MPLNLSWLGWLVLAIAAGAFVEALDSSGVVSLSSISDAYALPLPHRVEFFGLVERPHFSGESLVFDVKNNGLITCYFRRPPSSLFIFSRDYFFIQASLVQTPRGRLCIVESMRDSNAALGVLK